MKIPDVYIEELARDEIAGMVGHDIQKPGFVLGIAQASDSLVFTGGEGFLDPQSGIRPPPSRGTPNPRSDIHVPRFRWIRY